MATHVETWPTDGTLTPTNQDLDWTLIEGVNIDLFEVASGVLSNRQAAAGANFTAVIRAEHDADTDDNAVETTALAVDRGTGNHAQLWIGCRGDDSSSTWLALQIWHSASGTVAAIRESVDGTRTSISSDVAVSVPAAIRIEAVGNQVTAWVGATQIGPLTTSILTGRRMFVGHFLSVHQTGDVQWGALTFADVASSTPVNVDLGHITEAETVNSIATGQPAFVALGHLSESETVHTIFSVGRLIDVGHIAEAEQVHPVGVLQPAATDLGHITESETLHPLTVTQPTAVALGHVTETETVGALTVAQPVAVTLGSAVETEAVHAVTVAGPVVVNLGHVAEAERAWGVAGPGPAIWVDVDVTVGEPTLRPAFDVGAPRLRWDVGEPRTRWQVGEPSLVPDRSGA